MTTLAFLALMICASYAGHLFALITFEGLRRKDDRSD